MLLTPRSCSRFPSSQSLPDVGSVSANLHSGDIHKSKSTPILDQAARPRLSATKHAQLQNILRSCAQPRKAEALTPLQKRENQVRAIRQYMKEKGIEISQELEQDLSDHLHRNVAVRAWLPTTPPFLVVCQPTPCVQTHDGKKLAEKRMESSLPAMDRSKSVPNLLVGADFKGHPERDPRGGRISGSCILASPRTRPRGDSVATSPFLFLFPSPKPKDVVS